ncbi:MobC family plasmid mobilization relaxosome protein [Bacteroides sp.]|uniref:MobC family plasmid mobilization relaxosome protein n=1 Tax=Bacteroides sp. TaxID=29523 RepID=UPI002632C571|nr:MobC family plasmid mobilization relaxosome protein [Bacteroides sp.]MDD3040629.1 MobC family plasmid mobilization relaxosome protein [Bacteroides sp.]
MADSIHCIKKTLRLMPREAKELAEKAKDVGMREAEYIRVLIRQKPNDYPEIRKLLKSLINEVNRIGININQIVFNHNSGLYLEEDKNRLVAYMRKLNTSVNEVVMQIGNQ